MLAVLTYVYTQGDFTKMQGEFFENVIAQLNAGADKKGVTAVGGHFKM